MTNNKKIIIIFGVICILAGCYSKMDDEFENIDKDTEYETLEIMLPNFYMEESGKADSLFEAIELFKKEEGIENVTVTVVPWEEIVYKYRTRFLLDESPDIIMMSEYGMYTNIINGRLYPLNEFLSSDITSDWMERYIKGVSKEGEIFGYIRNTDVRIMLYNKRIFKEAGITEEDLPNTWQEFIEVCQKLKLTLNDSQYPFGFIAGDTIHTPIMWSVLVYQQGERLFKEGKFDFTSEACIKSAQLYYDFVNTYEISPLSVAYNEEKFLSKEFASGNFAIIYSGSWAYNDILNYKLLESKDIGWFKIPTYDGKNQVTISGFWSFGISSKTQDPELAYNLLKKIINEEIVKSEYLNNTKWIPTRKSFLNINSNKQQYESYKLINEWAEYAQNYSSTQFDLDRPTEFYDILGTALTSIILEGNIEEKLKEALKWQIVIK